MTAPMVTEHKSFVVLAVTTAAILAGSSGTSCIIPDHGIVALVDCGASWCATAELAEALDLFDNVVQVQEPQPDGTSGWVTACVCMTPADDLILRAGDPPLQYELLRNQIIDAARQACLDTAIASGLDPDPPYPLDEQLDPSCYEAVTEIFRDGCCKRLNSECGTNNSCDADLDPTDGEAPAINETFTSGIDSADTTAAPDSSSGDMSSLEPYYVEISCTADTCRIGQPLIDAVLAAPELLLAEGTSLRFVGAEGQGRAIGLELQGVAPDTLAGHLGLRDGDVLLRVGELPLTTEAEVLEAASFVQGAEEITVLVRRDGVGHERQFVRGR